MTDFSHITEHLNELKQRVIKCVFAVLCISIVAYLSADKIYSFLMKPLAYAMKDGDVHNTQRMIYTNMSEGFVTYLKLAFITGLFISFPVILIQIWRFIAPALYKNEKSIFRAFLCATPILFFTGASLAFFYIMPLSLKFFLGFQSSAEQTLLPIQMEARIGDYLNLVITLCFAFGLCFELPVLLLLLAKLGFIKAAQLRAIRRYVIVIVLTIAAVLTPPDLLSQILLAIPLYALYEISVLCVAWMERHALSNPPIDATQNDEF